MVETTRPELELVRRAIGPGVLAIAIATAVAWGVAGRAAGVSAALGAAIGLANFAANGVSLAWAAGVSVTAVHAVALGGVLVRLGAIVAVLFVLSGTAWFSPTAFGLTIVPGTLILLGFEARLVARGLGGVLQVPADPVMTRAAEALRAAEASR